MNKGFTRVYCGDGKGKTTAALGIGLQEASHGKSIVVVQCLKNKDAEETNFVNRLEPEIKFFRFEKSADSYDHLNEEEKKEEILNIKNGMNFAKKVLATGGCNVLILDEVLGLIDKNVLTIEELRTIIEAKDEETELIITGRNMPKELLDLVDEVYEIEAVKQNENL